MKHQTLLLFPNQLFENPFEGFNNIDFQSSEIILIEDSLFFIDHEYPVNFHCKKLIFHRASMQLAADNYRAQGFDVSYLNWQKNSLDIFFNSFFSQDIPNNNRELLLYDTVDFALNKRLKKLAKAHLVNLIWQQSPLFINSNKQNKEFRANKKRWFMAEFYQYQRKRLSILMEGDKPAGGKWSFDEDNRKKIPKKQRTNIPNIHFPKESKWITEAKSYVAETFPNALGKSDNFEYPIDHSSAKIWLTEFFDQRFENFGVYEDALVPQRGWLYHSILTPLLNTGLLKPTDVVDATLAYAKKNAIPINSVEGFIRQIIGWREFVRATYVDLGVTMRTSNHWQHHRDIPASFYNGTTGIKPIDDVIKRTLDSAYCHHIERLMVLGGFMFLCEFEPKQIYCWFMEMFIDAYDWVMVPNVYAMSQHADGGLITTKPYFSGSSYLRKMGYDDLSLNSPEDHDWCARWEGLEWRWIDKHSEELRKIPSWAMMCSMARKMDADKLLKHRVIADQFLSNISRN